VFARAGTPVEIVIDALTVMVELSGEPFRAQ
jgi:hypothetical protein